MSLCGKSIEHGTISSSKSSTRWRVIACAAFATVGGWMGIAPQAASAAPYDYSVGSTYSAQLKNYYCGAATAQMILSSAGVTAANMPTQANLFTSIVNNQGGNYSGDPPAVAPNKYSNIPVNGNYFTAPAGLRATLAANDPAHTWVNYAIGDANTANRVLAYDISHYQVAAGALVNAGAHWITVVGVNTTSPGATPNIAPVAGTAFTVNGFYVRDPWTGSTFATAASPGLGLNAYLATTGADAKWPANFTTTNYGGAPQGKFAFVADPDPGEDAVDPVFPNAPASGPELNGSQAIASAISDLSSVPGLSGDSDFQSGSFTTSGEMEVAAGGNLADPEWLVPYDQGANETGLALIDANTGVLDAAYWDEGAALPANFESDIAASDTVVPVPLDNIPSVPEPASLGLLGLGGIVLTQRRVRRGNV